MLAVVVVWVVVLGPAQSPQFGKAVAAAALYVSNWQLIFQHVSYFARFGPPSPLNHLWSLGVEEQFYILWPLLLLVGLRFVRERTEHAGVRPRLAAVTLLLAAARRRRRWRCSTTRASTPRASTSGPTRARSNCSPARRSRWSGRARG